MDCCGSNKPKETDKEIKKEQTGTELKAGKNTSIFPHSYIPVTPIPSIQYGTVYPNISEAV